MSAAVPDGPPRRTEEEIVQRITEHGPALVAMSGGVDSALVASLAREALGARSLAVTVESPAVAAREVARARAVADAIGIAHRVVPADPLARPEYRRNDARRCYFCRSVETDALRAIGSSEGVRQYLDGVHLDDLDEDRPGLRAMEEAGFLHPLVWAGWSKAPIREAARRRGLPNWDEPSDACLSSRVARGEPISAELLSRIEIGEARLRARGFRRVRLRVRDGGARVEVDPDEVERLTAAPLAAELCAELASLGFAPVVLDPSGYRGRPALRGVR